LTGLPLLRSDSDTFEVVDASAIGSLELDADEVGNSSDTLSPALATGCIGATSDIASAKSSPSPDNTIIVQVDPKMACKPTVAVGWNTLPIQTGVSSSCGVHPSDVADQSFVVSLESKLSWDNVGISWLQINPNSSSFQTGTFDTISAQCAVSINVNPEGIVHTWRIRFPHPYTVPPRVLVWLIGFDIRKSKSKSFLDLSASDITESGFDMVVSSHPNFECTQAQWIAFPPHQRGVSGGRFRSDGCTRAGTVMFEKPFTNAPSVFTAISGFGTTSKKSKRKLVIGVNADSIGSQRMDWSIDKQKPTVLDDIIVSYLAFDIGE